MSVGEQKTVPTGTTAYRVQLVGCDIKRADSLPFHQFNSACMNFIRTKVPSLSPTLLPARTFVETAALQLISMIILLLISQIFWHKPVYW